MSDIITADDAATLLAAMEANLTAFWMDYGQSPTGESHTNASLSSFSSLMRHPLFNAVFGGKFSDAAACDQAVHDVTAYFQAKQRPAMWWVGPTSQSPTLMDVLKRNAWHHLGEVPAMLLDLHMLRQDDVPIADLSLERVQDDLSLRAWTDILGVANDIAPYMLDDLYKVEATRGFSDDGYVRYLARFNAQPVATSAVYYSHGMAGIFSVATDAKYRGRGFGRAVTTAPLLDAIQRGYKFSVLQATELGYPIYKRLGFEHRWMISLFAHQ